MTVVASPQITVQDSEAVCLTDFYATIETSTGSNSYGKDDPSVVYYVNGFLHWGGNSSVTATGPTRGALLPANLYAWSKLREMLHSDEFWVIAPTGQTVTVEALAAGVKELDD